LPAPLTISMQQSNVVLEDSQWALCVQQWVADAGILNEDVERRVQEAFAAVPRIHFVDPSYHHHVLKDVDLPIDEGQWLTRTSLLIRMMGLINLDKRMRILELGFGSGYLCAVMAAAGAQVFGIDAIGTLAQTSRRHLDALKYHGVIVRRGEGRKGWTDAGPFDVIVVSYQVLTEGELPLSQLSDGGVLVAPFTEDCKTRLMVWRKSGNAIKRVAFEEVEFR
jgi:protein-L-isoaspartate(D-aspartate) O-methyltransferase